MTRRNPTGRTGWFPLLLLLLLAGCSSIQFAYNQLDRWMRWQVDDYVDLNSAQKQQLKAALDSFHRWHRQTQLPHYAAFMQGLATRVEQGHLERLRLLPIETQVEEFKDTASNQFYSLLLPLAPQLSSGQIDGLEQKLREKRAERLEKWRKSPEKIQRRRKKQIRKHSERWLGSLTDEQESLVSAWVDQVAYNPLLRDHQQEIWQAQFLEVLRRKPEGYLDRLRDLLINPQQLWSDDYRRMQEQRRAKARELAGQILATTTEEQRRHLADRLREYADDFTALSQQ